MSATEITTAAVEPWYRANGFRQLSLLVSWSLQRSFLVGSCLYIVGRFRELMIERIYAASGSIVDHDVISSIFSGFIALYSVALQFARWGGPYLPTGLNLLIVLFSVLLLFGKLLAQRIRGWIAKRSWLKSNDNDLSPSQKGIIFDIERISLSLASLLGIFGYLFIGAGLLAAIGAGSAALYVQSIDAIVARKCPNECDWFATDKRLVKGIAALTTSDRLYIRTRNGVAVVQQEDLRFIRRRPLAWSLHGLDRVEEVLGLETWKASGR